MDKKAKIVTIIILSVFVVGWCFVLFHTFNKTTPSAGEEVVNNSNSKGTSESNPDTEISNPKENLPIDNELDTIDSNSTLEVFDENIITFSRQTAGYIKPAEKPRVDPSGGFRGRLLSEAEKSKVKSGNYLSIGQEIVYDSISFKVSNAVFSEKEGNFADSNNTAPYYNVYVVINCDIQNNDLTTPHELSSKYSFKLIEGCCHEFSDSSVDEKEYYSYYHDISPNTQICGATVSFIGSRSLLTNSKDIIIELLCDNEPVAYWKIEPSFVN